MIEEPRSEPADLLRQPREVLARYFDGRLTDLILKDRACVKAFGLCALDFSPIWDSQDPAGTTVRISTEMALEEVTVRLSNPTLKAPTRLTYRVVKTAAGYRISNLLFEDPSRPSLLKLLETQQVR